MGSSPLPISPDWQYLFGMEIQTLCGFCSSSNLVPEHFRNDAIALADRLVDEKITLVYGGGSVGLMGVLADRILEKGGGVIGVIPEFLRRGGRAHEGARGGFAPILAPFLHAENPRMVSRKNLGLGEVVDSAALVVDTLLRRRDPAGAIPRPF